MNAVDVLMWIVIGGAIFLVALLFLRSLCAIAKLSDESSEEYWKKHFERGEENDGEPM